MLNELDTYLEAKAQRYVRYADDFSIYTKSKSKAQQVGNQVYLFLKNKLKLSINREKSGICRPVNFQLLGYGFVRMAAPSQYEKGSKGQYQLVVSEKSWKKLKAELKETTRKTTPSSFEERSTKLKQVQRGWLNYFRLANIVGKLQAVDSWVRNRLRYCTGPPARLARLEETREEAEESDKVRRKARLGLCLEQNPKGRMGNRSKSSVGNNYHLGSATKMSIRKYGSALPKSESYV